MDRSHLFAAVIFACSTFLTPTFAVGSISPFKWLELPDTAETVAKNGYPVETHFVTTEDGYILKVFRIPHGINSNAIERNARGKPLLLQHGILCSSDCWTIGSVEKSLAYVLADHGYDVWVSNSRGNTYSRTHMNLSTKSDAFWNFSVHELGYYDLPAVIDYILENTGEKKLTYIGHSQGTTIFFIMASCRPEYGDKVKVMTALAPVAYLDSTKGLVKALSRVSNFLLLITKIFHMNYLLDHPLLIRILDDLICNSMFKFLCKDLLGFITGPDSSQYNATLVKMGGEYCPTGASVKQLAHFSQMTQNGGKFTMFDYGKKQNLVIYNSTTPPEYNLKNIRTPIFLHHGANDYLSSFEEVVRLSEQLKFMAGRYLVPLKNFNHLDFMWAIDVNELLYNQVISLIAKYH